MTGPAALTVAEAAAIISEAAGQTIIHLDMVEQITGTPARDFRDFARTNAAAWKGASK